MAYAEHTLVTFGGQLGAGGAATTLDRWQCGVRCANNVNGSPVGAVSAPDVYIGLVGAALKTVLTNGSGTLAKLASDCSVDFIKVAQIGANGKYLPGSGSPYLYTTGLPFTGGTGRVGPPMSALKATFTTPLKRGRGHIGGIYLPFIGYAGWNTSTISAAAQTDYTNWAKAILTAIAQGQPNLPSNVQPCIASKLDGSLHQINGVKMGNVIDVQRRRKEQVVETYGTLVACP